MVIAAAAGISSPPAGSTVSTTSSPPSAHALDTSVAGGDRARDAVPGLRSGAGAGARTEPSSGPGVDVARPDKVVGPLGVGGTDYGHRRTDDAEVKVELNVGDQVLVGIYANPGTLFADPAQPLRDEP
jgi:hypothetical protein